MPGNLFLNDDGSNTSDKKKRGGIFSTKKKKEKLDRNIINEQLIAATTTTKLKGGLGAGANNTSSNHNSLSVSNDNIEREDSTGSKSLSQQQQSMNQNDISINVMQVNDTIYTENPLRMPLQGGIGPPLLVNRFGNNDDSLMSPLSNSSNRGGKGIASPPSVAGAHTPTGNGGSGIVGGGGGQSTLPPLYYPMELFHYDETDFLIIASMQGSSLTSFEATMIKFMNYFESLQDLHEGIMCVCYKIICFMRFILFI